jgi:hypothetical protein
MIISHSRAHHTRAVSLISERSKHSRRDLVIGSYRPKDVEHVLEVPFITERQSYVAFVDGMEELQLRWVGGFQEVADPHAPSVCERVSGDLAWSRYRTKGERYPLIRGRNVNTLV